MPDYTLTADEGLFTYTGQAADVIYRHRLKASVQGVFVLDGQAITLLRTVKLDAENASFTLSGKNATIRPSRRLEAETGSFTLSGQSATLQVTRRLRASVQGVFALAGQDVALIYGRTGFAASFGAFALLEQSANLKISRKILAGNGRFYLLGQQANLLSIGQDAQGCCDIPISDIYSNSFACPSNLEIIPNLECTLEQYNAFVEGWNMVSFCDSESPYLPTEQWYIDPESIPLNCA